MSLGGSHVSGWLSRLWVALTSLGGSLGGSLARSRGVYMALMPALGPAGLQTVAELAKQKP